MSQRLAERKISGPAAQRKKHPRACSVRWLNSCSQQQSLLFSRAAVDSRMSVLGKAQGIKKGASWPAGRRSNDTFLPCTFMHNKQMSQSERKGSPPAAPHQQAWLARFLVPVVLSVKPGCPVSAMLIIVFIPLKTSWLGAELNRFVNNVYPFSCHQADNQLLALKIN